MKKFLMGLIVGMGIMASGFVFADDGLEKVEAYLRPTLPITLNGDPVTLESAPVMYDGSTYLKLRDVAKLTNLDVNWNDTTQTVELGNVSEGGSGVTETTNSDSSIDDKNTTEKKELTPEQKERRIKGITELIASQTMILEENKKLLNMYKETQPDNAERLKFLQETITKQEADIADYEQQKAELSK